MGLGENKNVYLDMAANGLSAMINIARNNEKFSEISA